MSTLGSLSVGEFLEQLGGKVPAPGGGAAAAVTGATAAATAQMVVSYSLGKKSLAAHEGELREADRSLRNAREMFLALADEDAAAYEGLNALFKLPADAPERRERMAEAVGRALQPPRATLAACANLLRLLERLAAITNRQLRSDLAIAAVLADGAAHASGWNVRINLPLVEDAAERIRLSEETGAALAEISQRRVRVEGACSA